MRNFDKEMAKVINDYVYDYSVEELFQELFGEDFDAGELVVDMFNAGLIPNDIMEGFVNNE